MFSPSSAHSETQQGIFDAVLKGHIDFDSDPWPLISDSAKDLIRKMLCSRPSDRLTAHEVLCMYTFPHVLSFYKRRSKIPVTYGMRISKFFCRSLILFSAELELYDMVTCWGILGCCL